MAKNLIKKHMKHISLAELAAELKVNKSKLAYYFQLGLLKPVLTVGRMNLFDEKEAKQTIKEIEKFKKQGLKLKQIKTV